MSALPRQKWTPEEYLAFERASDQRHEFLDGEVVAMAGANERDNLITGNTYATLHAQLRRRPCLVYPSDMRVQVSPTGLYTYPDITVVCATPKFEDEHRDTLLNPTVIIEVLSSSTESYDRGKKFQHYRHLDSLQEYVLISQDSYRIERYTRQPDNQWLLADVSESDGILELSSIQCTLAAADVYEKVSFEDDDEAEQ